MGAILLTDTLSAHFYQYNSAYSIRTMVKSHQKTMPLQSVARILQENELHIKKLLFFEKKNEISHQKIKGSDRWYIEHSILESNFVLLKWFSLHFEKKSAPFRFEPVTFVNCVRFRKIWKLVWAVDTSNCYDFNCNQLHLMNQFVNQNSTIARACPMPIERHYTNSIQQFLCRKCLVDGKC